MKKTSTFILVLFFGLVFNSFAQTAPKTDFYAGKWEISITGTPRGDVKFMTNLVRKEGKLTGELVTGTDATDKRSITKIEESTTKLLIYFESTQGGEISIELEKVDDNTLKGSLMSFDATAKRAKE